MKIKSIAGIALVAALAATSPAFAKGSSIKVGGNVTIKATEGGVVTALAIKDSTAKNANGSMIGDIEVGGNVDITATRKKVTTALAIMNSHACNYNGTMDSQGC